MAWQQVLKASSEAEARAAKPAIADIPAGSKVRITIEGIPAPLSWLGDLAGMELLASRLYPEVEVRDVRTEAGTIIIEGIAKGAGVIAIALIVFAALIIIGLATYGLVTIFADIPPAVAMAGSIGLVLLLGIILIGLGRETLGRESGGYG